MEEHGVRFQSSLSGTLSLGRTNAFFLGGGKARVLTAISARLRPGAETRRSSCSSGWGLTGLVLYGATGTEAVGTLLAIHLATVLTVFLLTPYTKMAHAPTASPPSFATRRSRADAHRSATSSEGVGIGLEIYPAAGAVTNRYCGALHSSESVPVVFTAAIMRLIALST